MFKKIHRVSSWLFPTLMKSKTLFSQSFRLKYQKNTDILKISVVIPKKIIKKRVQRNRLKRQILHMLQKIILKNNNYYVFWLTRDISKTPIDQWEKELSLLVSKTNKDNS